MKNQRAESQLREKDNEKRKTYIREYMKNKRNDTAFRGRKNQKKRRKKISDVIRSFHKNIERGPEYVCTCCHQLWFRSSVKKGNLLVYSHCPQNIVKLCLTGCKSVDNEEWICFTCDSNIQVGELPSFAKANKMNFPDKPEVLN